MGKMKFLRSKETAEGGRQFSLLGNIKKGIYHIVDIVSAVINTNESRWKGGYQMNLILANKAGETVHAVALSDSFAIGYCDYKQRQEKAGKPVLPLGTIVNAKGKKENVFDPFAVGDNEVEINDKLLWDIPTCACLAP